MARIFGSRWRVIKSIGEGGQSRVFTVVDEAGEFDGEWALKLLKRKDRVARFRKEVEIMRRLKDDHIIKLIDAEVREDGGDDTSYLVMPLAEQGDLSARLALYKDQLESVVSVALQIAQALKHAHDERVVHRDIKPGNILFPSVSHDVWVSDFGLSYDADAGERHTPVDEVVGPRIFIAPELTDHGVHAVTPAADVYSLGQLAFYMLSGGRWVSQSDVLDQRYSEFFDKGQRHDLLRLLLAKMIVPLKSRYQNMTPVIRELEQIANWEKQAAGFLLDASSLQSIAGLQQQIAQELKKQADAEALRNHEQALLETVSVSARDWFTNQLEAQKAVLGAGDNMAVDVYVNDPINRHPLTVQTANTILQQRQLVSLFIRPRTKKGYIAHVLHINVCHEVNHTLPYEDPAYLGKPGNPAMAILPTLEFRDDTPQSRMIELPPDYVIGQPRRHGVTNPIPTTNAPLWHPLVTHHTYVDGNFAISRFDALDWPAATSTFTEMLREALTALIRRISF